MSLTRNELVGLLKVATAYDGRERGKPDVLAWFDSAQRAGWTYPEALEAVKDHFAFDSGFLTPAVITQRNIAARTDAETARLREIGDARRAAIDASGPSPADPERVRSLVETLAGTLCWQRKPKQQPAALRVTCPHCQAAPGRPCALQVRRGGPRSGEYLPLRGVHSSRATEAQRASRE
jgi:hypothetical protein